jgi:Ca2+-binding EF-hand superfamily protein
MNSQHSIWDIHNGELLSYSISLNKGLIPSFSDFLKDIYADITSRKEENEHLGKMSKISFENFMDLPLIVTEKIFKTLDRGGKDYLDLDDFVEGLFTLYAGPIQERIKLIFEIFDSQSSGKAMKEDVLLLLSYLHQTEYDDEMESLNEIHENFWGNTKLMDLKEFQNSLENRNSDILILFLLYLQMLKPFNDESVKFYHQIKTHTLNSKIPQKAKSFNTTYNFEDGRDSHSSSHQDIAEYYLFNKIIFPSKNLINYVSHYFHLNLHLPTRKTSIFSNSENGHLNLPHPTSSTNSANSIIRVDSDDTCNSFSQKNSNNIITHQHSGNLSEEELNHTANEKLNILSSPRSSQTQQKSGEDYSHSIDDHYNTCWESDHSLNQNLHDSKEKLNLSGINHHKCYPGHEHYSHDHSFSSFSSEISFSKNSHSHLTDDHTEIDVFKITNCVKAYKLISIGNVIYLFRDKQTNNVHQVHSHIHAPTNLFPNYSTNNFIFSNELETNEHHLDYKNYRGLHFLSGCYVDVQEGVTIEGESYFPMKFTSNYGCKVIYDFLYVKNYEDLKLFVEKLKFKMGIRNIADYYELYEELGKGQFGSVRLARNRKTSEKVAVKIIKKTYIKSKEIQMIKWELDIMRFLKHTTNPYVVKTHDIFEGKSSYYIVLEHLEGGNLSNFLVDLGAVIKESYAKELMLQVCRGVKYLHQFGIIHRDLKPENLMLIKKCSLPQIKIMDFGLSKVVSFYDRTNEGYGSLCYLAPEILLKQGYDHKVDIWSLGVILYYLLSGYLPFDDSKDEIVKIAKRIVNLDLCFIFNDKTKHFSNALKSLITKCFERNPMKRISSTKMVECEWFQQILQK